MNLPDFVLMIAIFVASGCGYFKADASNQPVALPTTTMQLGGHSYTLEKAITPKQQELGLMHRDQLPDGHGMIFPFDTERADPFWNHDVRFALDVIYVDTSGKVVSIQQMKAYSEDTTNPVMARYVIELNKGTAKALGIKEGDQLQIPSDVVRK